MRTLLILIVLIVLLLALVRCDINRASGSVLDPVHLPIPILAEFTGHAATLARFNLPHRAARTGPGF